MVLDSGAMPYSELQFNYNGLIYLYSKTGEDTKRKKYEEKKREWEKLQKKAKEDTDKEDKEGTAMMDFMQIINFVKDN